MRKYGICTDKNSALNNTGINTGKINCQNAGKNGVKSTIKNAQRYQKSDREKNASFKTDKNKQKIKKTAKIPEKLLAKLLAEMYLSDKSLNENCEHNLK